MKVYFSVFAVSVCLLLSGYMHCVKSNIGEKILEDNREFDMAPEYLVTEFYEDEQFVYFKAPVQTSLCQSYILAPAGYWRSLHFTGNRNFGGFF